MKTKTVLVVRLDSGAEGVKTLLLSSGGASEQAAVKVAFESIGGTVQNATGVVIAPEYVQFSGAQNPVVGAALQPAQGFFTL